MELQFKNKLRYDKSFFKVDKHRERFSLENSTATLNRSFELPQKNECVRMISPESGWSSTSLILAIAKKTKIKSMHATTLRVGKKEIDALAGLRIPEALIVCGGISRETVRRGKDYGYSDYFEKKCDAVGYKYKYMRNHSKVILLKTDNDKIVIETSSNLNENPKIEQFILTNSDSVYDYYMSNFKEMEVF